MTLHNAQQLRRLTISIFGGVALGATGLMAALTVAPIAALEMTGSPTLTGLPAALGIIGTALGATLVSRVMAQRGARRPGLVLGYAIAAAGALLTGAALLVPSFPLLCASMVLIGSGNAASNLARYAAADPYPAARRSAVIGWIVWAATIGAVAGPTLGTWAAKPLEARGLPPLAGGFLVACACFLAGAVVFLLLLRPDPAELALPTGPVPAAGADTTDAHGAELQTRLAVAGMVVSHSVMVLTMTMAPVHLRHHGTQLPAIGLVMSSHVVGMFALTPLAGYLAQRLGNVPVLVTGLVLLSVAGAGAGLAPDGSAVGMGAALFLLGLGWSCGFVAASGVLAQGAHAIERARRQGRADTMVFASAAAASLVSGVIVAAVGYAALAFVGSFIALAAALIMLRHRRIPAGRAEQVAPAAGA